MSQAGQLNTVSSNPSIPTTFRTDDGDAIPELNILQVVGGAGITTSGIDNVLTISLTAANVVWLEVTSADNPVNMMAGRGYIAKGAGVVNFALPAVAALGDVIYIEGYGNLWTLAQGAGQRVILGIVSSTVGALGSVAATQVSDALTLICVTTNTEFKAISSIGNPTFV